MNTNTSLQEIFDLGVRYIRSNKKTTDYLYLRDSVRQYLEHEGYDCGGKGYIERKNFPEKKLRIAGYIGHAYYPHLELSACLEIIDEEWSTEWRLCGFQSDLEKDIESAFKELAEKFYLNYSFI